MTKAQKLSSEEVAFREAEAAKRSKNTIMMKQLAINADKQDEQGNKIEPDTWHVRGENQYIDTVTFRPLRYKQKFIRMVQNGKTWRTDNESIFVEGFEPAYDVKGGIGCGRIIGSLPDHWTKEQQLVNFKKASIYGFLFGLVTFPGKKPVLVNFRAAPAKTKAIREALSKKSIGDIPFDKIEYKLKLYTNKGDKFVTLEVTPDLNNVKDDFSEVYPHIKEVDAYIEAHNANIMRKREQLMQNLKANEVYKDVGSLADDFNDEVPFGEK